MAILDEFGVPFKNEATTLKSKKSFLVDWLRAGRETSSGVVVNENTALKVAAVFACVNVISQDVAKLPLLLYERMAPRGKKRAANNPLYRILSLRPNNEMTSFGFRRTVTFFAAFTGNGYAEIKRNGSGVVESLHPIESWRVTPTRTEDGELIYLAKNPRTGRERVLFKHEMFHIPSLGIGSVGFHTLTLASEAIGNAKAAAQYSGSFFANDATPSFFLKHPQLLDEEAHQRLKESFSGGGPEDAHKVRILEEDMDVFKLSADPEVSQMIESQQHGVEDICRYWRIAPHKIQHLLHSNFSTIEESNIDHVVDTLMPWLTCWEQEIAVKLIPPSRQGNGEGDLFAEHLVQGLMRGNQQSRSSFYSQLFNIAGLSPNDIRELENLNPIDDPAADKYYVQGALRPIDEPYSGGTEEAAGAAAPQPEKEAKTPAPRSDISDICVYAVEPLADAFDKLLSVEQDRVSRAARKPEGFDDWMEEFYAEHVAHVGMQISSHMLTACRMLWMAIGGSPTMPPALSASATVSARDAAQRHCEQSKLDIKTPHGWEPMRGRLQAAREVERLRHLVETFAGEEQ